MKNPYTIVKDFEAAVCEYTGAPYCVAVNSCTSALLLAVAWSIRPMLNPYVDDWTARPEVEIPKRTYVSVPMSIIHAGGRPTFRDEEWSGAYQLKPLPVWDSARRFTSNMYKERTEIYTDEPNTVRQKTFSVPPGQMLCVSFHASKILGDTQGGAILHDNPEADKWLRRARFDGRTEGVPPTEDNFTHIGWHCYMSNDVAARLMLKIRTLPLRNPDLPNDEYPDLSKLEIFK